MEDQYGLYILKVKLDQGDWLVTVTWSYEFIYDMIKGMISYGKTKRVIGSVVPYTNGEEDLSTDDADLVKAKPSFFMHFLPAEFPKFLNLQR